MANNAETIMTHTTTSPEQMIKGDFLIVKETMGRSFIFTAYKRIYGNQFRTKYNEVKSYKGNRYGKITSEKITFANGVNSSSVNIVLKELKEKIYNSAYKAITLAYPETNEGNKQFGMIVLNY
jgi:hypothetical protein